MKPITQYRLLLAAAMVAALVLGATGIAYAVQNFTFSGAIFTTNYSGTTVDQNIYGAKTDVYLNGGPQNNHSAGLPNGTYYFQVTDPDGTLLSSDNAVCRQLIVSNGVVAGAATVGGCPHPNGATNPANGSTTVQLAPFNDTGNPGGEYKVWLIAQTANTSIDGTDPKVLIFQNNDSKTDNFKVLPTPPTNPVSNISGAKFYDANVNGTWDQGEPGIPFWKIVLFGDASNNTTTVSTPNPGFYLFPNLADGTYGVCEILPSNPPTWIPTRPTSISPIIVPPDSTDNNFGNVCLGAGGGLTLGFWSNKNGQALVGSDDLLMLYNLNLRNADGSNFNPTTYSQFRTWLLSANATNMAYMLSAQLAAMELNVLNGKVTGNPTVYAGTLVPNGCTVPGLSSTGFISINDLMNAADHTSSYPLSTNGITTSAFADARNCQQYMKNALDEANNDHNFVQPTPCAVNYSGTETSCAQ